MCTAYDWTKLAVMWLLFSFSCIQVYRASKRLREAEAEFKRKHR